MYRFQVQRCKAMIFSANSWIMNHQAHREAPFETCAASYVTNNTSKTAPSTNTPSIGAHGIKSREMTQRNTNWIQTVLRIIDRKFTKPPMRWLIICQLTASSISKDQQMADELRSPLLPNSTGQFVNSANICELSRLTKTVYLMWHHRHCDLHFTSEKCLPNQTGNTERTKQQKYCRFNGSGNMK